MRVEKRELLFLVADSQAQAVLKAFFRRQDVYALLGVPPFDFNAETDIRVVEDNDPGVFNNAPSLARVYRREYKHLIVLLDEQWDHAGFNNGGRKQKNLARRIRKNRNFPTENFRVIVIRPEIESWVWQDSKAMIDVFKFDQLRDFRPDESIGTYLSRYDLWDAHKRKPLMPKETLHELCGRVRMATARPDGVNYGKVVSRLDIARCTDPAYLELKDALYNWFRANPIEATPTEIKEAVPEKSQMSLFVNETTILISQEVTT